MATDLNSVVPLTRAQIQPAAEMLSRAFNDYPLGDFFHPEAADRESPPPTHGFQSGLRYGLLYGEVYASSPNLEGVAAWLPSDKVRRTLWRNIRSGNFPTLFGAEREMRSKQRVFHHHTAAIRQRHAPPAYLYLQMVGIDPAYQGKGYGSRLLRHMFARIDAIHLPCYLETHTERNVAFYEHRGFKVVEAQKIPGSEIMTWAMLRDNR